MTPLNFEVGGKWSWVQQCDLFFFLTFVDANCWIVFVNHARVVSSLRGGLYIEVAGAKLLLCTDSHIPQLG